MTILNYYMIWPGLIAGEYPGSSNESEVHPKLAFLSQLGVTLYVDLTEPGELKPYAEFLKEFPQAKHRRFPIVDQSVPKDFSIVSDILHAINDEMSEGGTAYVHCWGGIGRTGLVAACWLCQLGQPAESALDTVEALYATTPKVKRIPNSPENEEQRNFVRQWAGLLLT